MPLFHFHFHDGTTRHDDEIGLELPDAEAAYLQAIAAAKGMGNHLIEDGVNPALCSFEVTTAGGALLFSIAFSELFVPGEPVIPVPHRATERVMLALESTHKRAQTAKAEMAHSLLQTRATLADCHALLSRLTTLERQRPRPDAC